jgi:hypothetical protein
VYFLYTTVDSGTMYEVLATYKNLNKQIGKSGHNVFDFFTKDSDGNSTSTGIYNFFDTVQSEVNTAQHKYAWLKDGKYYLDFGVGGDKDIAKKLGVDVETVQSILRAAIDAGFDVNLDSITSYDEKLNLMKSSAENAASALYKCDEYSDTLFELGKTDFAFNFNSADIDDIKSQVEVAQVTLNKFKDSNGKINLNDDDAKNAQKVLETLLAQQYSLEKPVVMNVDTSQINSDSVKATITRIQTYIKASQDYEIKLKTGVDTTESAKNLKAAIAALEGDTSIKLGADADTNDLNTAIDAINQYIDENFGTQDELLKFGVDKAALKLVADQVTETVTQVINNLPDIGLRINIAGDTVEDKIKILLLTQHINMIMLFMAC